MMPEPLNIHVETVAKAMGDGRVIPLLGAGVNCCGRQPGAKWIFGENDCLPDGTELTEDLATSFNYPAEAVRELVRVSQWAAVMQGTGPLYERLRAVFNVDYPPTPVHELLARQPATWRAKGHDSPPYQLIMTTNYDDALERAFENQKEPFDLVTYVAQGANRGKFLHRDPNGNVRVVKKSNQDLLSLEQRTIILKIHGALNRSNPKQDSFVISEDNYIDYLSQVSVSNVMPVMLNDHMQESHFLFLGYSMRDWNLRVILRRILAEQTLDYKWWSIQLRPDELECEFWRKRNTDIYDVDLDEYVRLLQDALDRVPDAVQ
jgi:SIR2-like domain